MFIEIRESGNSKKYYLVYSYREKDHIKRASIYLGSNLKPKELLELRKKAERFILEKVKEKNILNFELSKEEIAWFKQYEKKIEISHLQVQEWKIFTEEFTYNTNAIEGSTLAFSEVKDLLDQKEKPENHDDLEALNVAKAVEFIKVSREKISVSLFLKIHFLCFKGTKTFAGKLREVEVVIKDSQGNIVHQGAPFSEVKKLLKHLCLWYEKHKQKYPPLLLAAVMHNEFEKIHPFQDGNGRVGRLLLNYVLLQHNYPPLNIKLKDRSGYYHCLQKYDLKGDIKSTLRFLIKSYKKP
ncbi:Fic family protein [Candidatus Woesearchaeota archaeon]|nr:Fic family protein [Candidatus Woesearchaeota archaeon]